MKSLKNLPNFLVIIFFLNFTVSCDITSDQAAQEIQKEFDRVYQEVQAELATEAERAINEKKDELVDEAGRAIEQKKEELLDQAGLTERYSITIKLVPKNTENCFEYVKAQRIANNLEVPYGGLGDCRAGLYDGSYNKEGSFTSSNGQVFSYGQTPTPGAIMLQSPKNTTVPCGHISIVSAVFYNSDDFPIRFIVSEAAWTGKGDNEFVYNWLTGRYDNKNGRRKYDSFIY
jgi:hypothetical protein